MADDCDQAERMCVQEKRSDILRQERSAISVWECQASNVDMCKPNRIYSQVTRETTYQVTGLKIGCSVWVPRPTAALNETH